MAADAMAADAMLRERLSDHETLSHTETTRHMSVFERLPLSEVNPFLNSTTKLTCYEMLKLLLGCCTLVPLRMALFLLSVLLCAFCCQILLLGAQKGQPLMGWRRSAASVVVSAEAR